MADNGYEDVAALIDQAVARIEAKGKKSRRNWWDTLAGGTDGKALSREGITFPVLAVAQRRQGKEATANAICRNASEQPPDVVTSKRWGRRRLPSRPKKPAALASRQSKKKTG
ncbi:MAG: hypothetical protein K2Y23_08975 [Cyanobacteria bacterium]|nr:hypothetical protein [Cyanobacteriota bacterium]